MSRRLAVIVVGAALAFGCECRPPREPRKVAVLIAAEWAEPIDSQNNSEFWYDTVLMYCMLRANGFEDEDIYVLYGRGDDGSYVPASPTAPTGGGASALGKYYTTHTYCGGGQPEKITDFPMVLGGGDIGCLVDDAGEWQCRPKAIFDCLASGCEDPSGKFTCPTCSSSMTPIRKLEGDDYLFVWWKGHGNTEEDSQFVLRVGFDTLSHETVNGWIGNIDVLASHRMFVFETCKSGCLRNTLGAGSILLASCGCGESSWATDTHDAWHGVFSFWIAGTLGRSLPPGSQNPIPGTDRPIDVSSDASVDSAFGESQKATVYEVGLTLEIPPQPKQQPLKSDSGNLAPSTHLDSLRPANQPGPA